MYQETELLKQKAQKAAEAYEPLRTAPQKALGDSIQKAFQNVDVLLKELGLENTKDNQRAVRILGYNQMEITQDNIGQIKAYDARVNEVLAGLKPAVTVELIRRGENPLNMTFEELKQSIDQIQESIGADAEEKYSTYLWKLEKQEGITAEERKSYIGIYRLLNHIEKTDGAAIGNVVNAGRELTLSNLLTAVRTIKNKGINQKIDDNFGGLTEISFASETITEQIESAFPKDDRTDYLQSLVKRTMEGLSPEQVVETFKNADGNGMDMSLEQFCERAMEQEKDAALEREYQKEQVKIFRETAENSSEAAAFLNAHGAEATVRNIQAAEAWFAGNRNLFKELDKKADNISKEKKDGYRKCAGELLESMSEEDSFREEYQKTVDSMKEIVSAEFADRELVSDEAENLRLMQKGILLASRLSRQEHYEMPVVIGEEVSSLSLTILKGTMDSGKAEIRIDFPEQGVMEATLTIKNNEIKGFILCKTTEGQQLIESCLEDMKKGFESLGLTVKQMHTGTDRKAAKRSIPENTPEGRPTETRMLYQAAKVLVKQTIERTQVINNEN